MNLGDPVVLGLLMASLGLIFYTSHSKNSFFQTFYKYVPALLLAYFIPAIIGMVIGYNPEESKLYYIASRIFLPASLILLTLSIDIKSVLGLGSKALIMFFTATLGIVLGGPIALWIVGTMDPSVLGDVPGDPNSIWKGLTTVAGSWIGGGANQTAMKEIYKSGETLFSAMIIVDVFVANIWMAFLLYGAGISKQLDKRLKADNSAIEKLKNSIAEYRGKILKPINTTDLVVLMAIVFTAVGLSHLVADNVSPVIDSFISGKLKADPDSGWRFMSAFGGHFFWLVVVATTAGLVLSFTKARSYEGIGASNIGTLFLYFLVATIGLKMDLIDLYNNWSDYRSLILIGLIWMAVHVTILLIVAKIIRAPFFYVAVGSQANVGGAASAPIVASAFSPSLAPVGVLLAVLGYALGTFAAILCAIMLQMVAA